MRIKWIVFVLLPIQLLYGQCDCDALKGRKVDGKDEVSLWIKTITNQYPTFQNNYSLTILPTDCNSIGMALLCDKGRYYILYRPDLTKLLKSSAPWNEKFTLAHELAHILQGHTFKLSVMGERTYTNKKFEKDVMPWGSHLEEFQADALAAYWLLHQNAKATDAAVVFEALRKITLPTAYFADSKTHPSLKARREFIQRICNAYRDGEIKIEKSRVQTSMLASEFYESYLRNNENTGVLEESERLALSDLKKWSVDLKNLKGVANDEARAGKYNKALEKRKELDSLYQILYWSYANEQEVEHNEAQIKRYERIVKAKSEWGFFVNGGIGYAQPTFKVPHRVSNPVQLGLTMARLTWYQPHSYEVRLSMRQQSWQTFRTPESTTAEEQFDWSALDIVAAYTYRSASKYKDQFYHNSSGWFATVGGGGAFPYSFRYQNQRLNSSLTGAENLSITPVATVSLGFEILNRRVYRGHLRAGATWLYSPLKIKNFTTNEPVSFHHVNLFLAFRVL